MDLEGNAPIVKPPESPGALTVRARAALAGAVAVVAGVYLFRLDHVVGLVVDDAWYVVLGQALTEGRGFRLISSAAVEILPAVPPGFPLLLAAVMKVAPAFPDNVTALKIVSVGAMFGVGAMTWTYARRVADLDVARAGAVAAATVLSPALVFLATSTVMAEAVFTCAQLGAVLLVERAARASRGEAPWRRAVPAGVVAAAAMLVRSAGVAVVVAAVVYLAGRRRWREAAWFVATVAVCLAPWWAYQRAHAPAPEARAEHGGTIAYAYETLLTLRVPGAPEAGRMSAGEWPVRIASNLYNVAARDVGGLLTPALLRGANESGLEVMALGGTVGRTAGSMGGAAPTQAISFALAGVVLIGFLAARDRLSMAALLAAATVAMVAVSPSRTFRYVLPLLPFVLCAFAVGVARLARWHGDGGVRRAASASRMALLVVTVFMAIEHVEYVTLARGAAPPAWHTEATEVEGLLTWMRDALPPGGAVASTNPGLVYLHTGRKGLVIDDPSRHWRRWRGRDVRYLVALRPIPRPRGPFVRGALYASANGQLWVLRM